MPTPNPNGNPFDVPLQSEVGEHQQAQAVTQNASPNGNPFDEPLVSEKASGAPSQAQDAAYIQKVNTGPLAPAGQAEKAMGEGRTNKEQAVDGLKNLAMAAGYTASAMVPGVGGAGPEAGELINAAGEPIGEGAKSVMGHLASTYGTPAMEAIKAAGESHPIVAKLLMHGLEYAGVAKAAKYLGVFGK